MYLTFFFVYINSGIEHSCSPLFFYGLVYYGLERETPCGSERKPKDPYRDPIKEFSYRRAIQRTVSSEVRGTPRSSPGEREVLEAEGLKHPLGA